MWLIAGLVALVLWFVFDNFLIATIMAIFGVYFWATIRALKQVKQQAPENQATLSTMVDKAMPARLDENKADNNDNDSE